MRLQFRYILMVTALLMFSASLALGGSVTITPTGAGSFVVQGDKLDGVSGMDLTIVYDATVLASPSITWGSLVSGALPIANTTTIPGTIRIVALRVDHPFSASGPIASVSFATHSADCGITAFSINMIDMLSAPVPTQAAIGTGAVCPKAVDPGLIATAGIPFSQPETTVTSTATSTTSTSATTIPGTIGMPGDKEQPKSETPPLAEPKTAPAAEHVEPTEPTTHELKQSRAEATAETSEPVVVKQTVYSGILERFQAYQGAKSPENLLALFKKPVSATIRQEPVVAISDGKRSVRVTIDISAINGASSNFALSEASLVSLKKDEVAGTWTLDVLPRLNSLKASVTILSNSAIIEFPLTVVPPVASISVKEADFALFLKDSGAPVPKHDLNGDGRHDYLDDFIYSAHYLLNRAASEPKNK